MINCFSLEAGKRTSDRTRSVKERGTAIKRRRGTRIEEEIVIVTRTATETESVTKIRTAEQIEKIAIAAGAKAETEIAGIAGIATDAGARVVISCVLEAKIARGHAALTGGVHEARVETAIVAKVDDEVPHQAGNHSPSSPLKNEMPVPCFACSFLKESSHSTLKSFSLPLARYEQCFAIGKSGYLTFFLVCTGARRKAHHLQQD